MSAINNSPVGAGLSAALPNFDFERQGLTLPAALAPGAGSASDGIRFDPSWRGPSAPPAYAPSGGYQDPQTNAGQSQFMGFISQLLGSISSLIGSLTSMFAQSPPQSAGGGEQSFANATAGSVGDPHETFSGTTAAGTGVDGHWDSMSSHGNLLSSNSFDGGFRIATTVTQPNANGVTLNDHVSVASNGGNTNVTMNKDGSYDVTSYGQHVDLVTGHAVHVNDGETVTKNNDGSLTIDDINGRGGSIETTLRSNGSGGVDVNATAKNVHLGGYLIDKQDGDADPVALAGRDGYGAPSYTLPPIAADPTFAPITYDPTTYRPDPSVEFA